MSMFDCLYLSPKLKQNTAQTHVLRMKHVANFKTHKSPPKRHDRNDFLNLSANLNPGKVYVCHDFHLWEYGG